MSDESPKRDDGSSSIPPELKAFVGQHEWPEAERRDEAEVDAAFAPVEAMVAEWQREADKRDAKRGIGNVAAYAAGVVIREAEKPAPEAAEPKVALAITDVPRALPSGNPNLPTEEISTRAFARARSGDDEVTEKRAAEKTGGTGAPAPSPDRPERTVGGNTERMPVIAVPTEAPTAASPWAKPTEDGAPPVEALSSALRPRDQGAHEDDAPGSVTPARRPADGRGRSMGLLAAGALALVVAAVGLRAMTRATPDGGTTSGGAAAPPVTASARAVEPRPTSQVTPPTAPPVPRATPTASATPSAQVLVPTPTAHPLAPQPKATNAPVDDPYDAAPPPPRSPMPQPTAQPAAPPLQPTAQPAAPAPPPPVSPAPLPTQKPAVPPTSAPGPLGGPPVY